MTDRAWTLIGIALATVMVWCWYRFLGGSRDTDEAAAWLEARISYLLERGRLRRQVRRLLKERKKQNRKKKGKTI